MCLEMGGFGGRLDFSWRARAGTLSRRVKNGTHGVAAVGAMLLGVWVEPRC